MKRLTLTCGECGATFMARRERLWVTNEDAGLIDVGVVDYRVCDGCGEQLYPYETWGLLDEAEEAAKALATKRKEIHPMQEQHVVKGYAIVVVDRGFVYVGDVEVGEDWCIVRSASNIRKWGTKCGLGQLALYGPTGETILDPCGTVRVPKHALISLLDTEQDKWTKS